MKRSFHLGLTAFVLGMFVILVDYQTASAKTDEIKSILVTQPIQVDGKFDDWPANAGIALPDQRAYIGISNDQNNLYLLFRTNDPRWARTIHMSGLTFNIDTKAGKKKNFFVRFMGGPSREEIRALAGKNPPMRPQEDMTQGQRERPGGMRPDMPPMGMDDMPTDSGPKLICFIKDRIVEKEIPLDGTEGPTAAFDTARGLFVWEFSIPLDSGSVRSYGLGVTPGNQISVGCVWGEMQREPERQHRPEIDFGGDQGGGMGGSMPAGRMGGQGGPMGRPEKQEVWLKTTLAKK